MRAQRSGRIVTVGSGTTRRPRPGFGAYAATKSAVNVITAVARDELHDDGVLVSLVSPSITASEFAGREWTPGTEIAPGVVVHSADYVGKVILRALRTGEERIDIPHGPERAELIAVPSA
jgi:short-subunit dehydrogenase